MAPGRSCVVLGFGDVPRLRTLGAIDDLEFDRLTLFQGPEAVATDRGVVHEHVAATLTFNEPVPFGVVEPLDLACDAHRSSSCLLGEWPAEASRLIACVSKHPPPLCALARSRRSVAKAEQMSFEAQKKTASACAASTSTLRERP